MSMQVQVHPQLNLIQNNDESITKVTAYLYTVKPPLLEALRTNTHVQHIVFSEFSNEYLARLFVILETNRHVKTLDVGMRSNNMLDFLVTATFQRFISENRTLTALAFRLYQQGDTAKALDSFYKMMASALKTNGMITLVRPWVAEMTNYLRRNRAAHERARQAAIAYINAFKKRRDLGEPNQQHARMIWESRADPKWWTEEERVEAGVERPVKRLRSCIQCLGNAVYSERDAPQRAFCGRYCQWIHHHGEPDLRGMTPEQIERAVMQ